MRCDQIRGLLGAYIDGELGAEDRRAVAAHLDGCPGCAERAADIRRLGRHLVAAAFEPAPAGLEGRLRGALDAVAAETAARAAPDRPDAARFGRLLRPALAAVAAAVVVALLAGWIVASHMARDRTAHDVLTAHVRSLLQDTPVQVASSDTHTVKPWFAGRADVAPTVRDLAADGYPLVGGRLDYVSERRVAAVVYRRRLHVINLFMWPAADAGESGAEVTMRNGYNLMTWRRNGLVYWAVSDLNAGELGQFAALL